MTRSAPAPESAQQAAPPSLSDQGQRDLIRTALDDTLVVEAAAGTGKTTELVRRMVAMLEAGRAELDRVVALTFTDAAAGELKLRLRAAIEDARLDESRPAAARDRLRAALPKLEEARSGTIHSFCADLLRERPVEAGVDPRFDVAPNDVALTIFERAFDRWFERQLADPGPAVRRILRRWKREPMFFQRGGDEGPRGTLRHAAWQLVQHRDFPTPWRHDRGFERDQQIDALLETMESLAEWSSRGPADDWFVKSLLEIAKLVEEVRRLERVRARDHDALEAWLSDVVRSKNRHWGWKGWDKKSDPEFPRADLLRKRDELHAGIKAFVELAGADLAPQLRDELWPVVEAYEAAKERTGCLDFNDLVLRARDLVRGNAQVRLELQRRFTHYFVDEFQDTDPLQAEILMLLAADDPTVTDWRKARAVRGKLFLVGDPKQSIYRFRRADVNLYREVQRRLVEQGAKRVELTVSFRSVPEIQEAVNAAFEPLLGGPAGDGNGAGSAYVPLARFRETHDGQPAIIALPVPSPYAPAKGNLPPKIFDYVIEESLPDAIAAWIDWLVRRSGWTVTERERPGARVPVEPRHVCILFRRFKSLSEDVTRPYVAALEARNISHLLVGGSSFHEREEIEALRNAMDAIERPDDELAVFATLRGPLIALSDASLLAWREKAGGLHPFRPTPEGLSPSLAEVADALALLRDLHRGRNLRPVADTIEFLLEATRAHAAFAIWPTGAQALANIGRLMDMARRAERQGLVSFRAFVDRLEDESERGDVAEAPLLEEGVEGVRIMKVHGAKGLEFPIVILADMTAKQTFEQPQRWTDNSRGLCVQRLAGCTPPELREHAQEEMTQEREEAIRLLYVAATRARDALVVPVISDERREGWLSALYPAVYPKAQKARSPVSRTAPGCPAFGEDSVAVRPAGMRMPLASVMPGMHTPVVGGHYVVWWDPGTLELGVRPSLGLSQAKLLEADQEGRAGAALASWESWRAAREQMRERGVTPTHVIVPATEWARTAGVEIEGAGAVDILDAAWKGERPKGPRFGTLVHALLAICALDSDEGMVAAQAAAQARLLGASESEREAAVQVTIAALAHPLLRRADAAARMGRCRREAPLVVRLGDGTLLECVVDLAFLDEGVWTVVDFKTDSELDTRLERYQRQVALYVQGIADGTGVPAQGFILRV
jgi:ATP-dependent helicase/nuclease subunit A